MAGYEGGGSAFFLFSVEFIIKIPPSFLPRASGVSARV